MSFIERSTYRPLTHWAFDVQRTDVNRRIKKACSDFLFFEHLENVPTWIPSAESFAASLRPGTTKFAILLLVFFLAIEVNLSSAVSPDTRLLALIPPKSEVVAGIRAASLHGRCGNYAFITNDNRVDLTDFIAITGSDESRIFDQVIFTASSGHDGKRNEHSILVSGHFNHDRIFRASNSKQAIIQYRGVAVLDVFPFEREWNFFKQSRWLAFLGSSAAIFGTVASVEVEIDRSLAGSPPDAAILQRLSRLQRNDEEWSLLPAIGHGAPVLYQLRLLDPTLANLAANRGSFAFGIRYGRRVELEFAVDPKSESNTASFSDSVSRPPAGLHNQESVLSSRPGISRVADPVEHRVLKLSKSQFEKWVAQASSATQGVLASSP